MEKCSNSQKQMSDTDCINMNDTAKNGNISITEVIFYKTQNRNYSFWNQKLNSFSLNVGLKISNENVKTATNKKDGDKKREMY